MKLSEEDHTAYFEKPTGNCGRSIPSWKTWAMVVQVFLGVIIHYNISHQSGKLFTEKLLLLPYLSGRNWCTKDCCQLGKLQLSSLCFWNQIPWQKWPYPKSNKFPISKKPNWRAIKPENSLVLSPPLLPVTILKGSAEGHQLHRTS